MAHDQMSVMYAACFWETAMLVLTCFIQHELDSQLHPWAVKRADGRARWLKEFRCKSMRDIELV